MLGMLRVFIMDKKKKHARVLKSSVADSDPFLVGSGLFASLGSGSKFIVNKRTPGIQIFSLYNIVLNTVYAK